MYLAQTSTTVVGTPPEASAIVEIPASDSLDSEIPSIAADAITPESITVEDGVIKIGNSEIPVSEIGSPSSIPSVSNPVLPDENTIQIPQGSARFADPHYYFNPTPFEQGPFLLGKPLAVLFTLILIISFSLLIRALLPRLKRRNVYRSVAYWLMFFGLAGYMFLYFRKDFVPYLSMRIWLALTLVGFFAWLIWQAIKYAKYRQSLLKRNI